MKPLTIPKLSSSTLAIGATQFVVQEALDRMWCAAGSYASSLTPITIVMSSSLAGAEMMTFFAPASRCALAVGPDGVAGHGHVGGQGAEHGVVLEQVRHGGDVTEVVRRHDLDATVAVRGVGGPPEVTADTPEAIDSDANCHSTKSPRRSP